MFHHYIVHLHHMKKIFLLLIFTAFIQCIMAQVPPNNLQDGSEFRNWVKANFHTNIIDPLGYDEARDKIYAYVENFEDTVECIYSGVKVYNDRGNEVGVLDPLNTEHLVPQSFYNEQEPMRGDIHILFPCYATWNSLRSNYQFAEIPDNETDQWIVNTSSTNSMPSNNINTYSEYLDDNNISDRAWEPRENRKGDIARAILYFYTMYPTFDLRAIGDIEVFCDWHENDLPGDREITRNDRIIDFQRNTNPYIEHPEWANRAWGCEVPTTAAFTNLVSNLVTLYPNPTLDILQIKINDWNQFPLTASLISLEGKNMIEIEIETNTTYVDMSKLPASNYILAIRNLDGKLLGNKKLIVE